MAWSATSSMKVSGQLVTGMPRLVATSTSTESTPTEPSDTTFSFLPASITRAVMRGRPLA